MSEIQTILVKNKYVTLNFNLEDYSKTQLRLKMMKVKKRISNQLTNSFCHILTVIQSYIYIIIFCIFISIGTTYMYVDLQKN